MALNQKGRLVYVTDKLAAMLGYSIANMAKMDLNLLMPPPYGQMHGTWLKVTLVRQSMRLASWRPELCLCRSLAP